jgi:hypothetical protein
LKERGIQGVRMMKIKYSNSINIAIAAGAVMLLADGAAECVSIRFGCEYAGAIARVVVAVVALIIAIITFTPQQQKKSGR